jgi:hypothetical protein
MERYSMKELMKAKGESEKNTKTTKSKSSW